MGARASEDSEEVVLPDNPEAESKGTSSTSIAHEPFETQGMLARAGPDKQGGPIPSEGYVPRQRAP